MFQLLLLQLLYFITDAQFVYPEECSIAFRLDDIQEGFLVSTQIDIINTFVNNGVPLTLGVIPNFFGTDPNSTLTPFIRNLLTNGTQIEIAAMSPNHEALESQTLEQQVAALSSARIRLNEVLPENPLPVTTFIAPFNIFDANTLQAIRITNYSTFSAAITSMVTENGTTYYNKFASNCTAANIGLVNRINHFPFSATLSSPVNTPIAVDFAISQVRDEMTRCPQVVIELNFISFQRNGVTDPALLNDLQILINEAKNSGCELKLLQNMGSSFPPTPTST